MTCSRDTSACCSLLLAAWPRVLVRLREVSGRDAQVTCVERTLADQAETYAEGRTRPGRIVTNADGVRVLSKHQRQTRHGETAVHALDLVILAGGAADWNSADYDAAMRAGEAEGLVSGLDWDDNGIRDSDERGSRPPRGPSDGPHLECSGKILPDASTAPVPISGDPDATLSMGPQT